MRAEDSKYEYCTFAGSLILIMPASKAIKRQLKKEVDKLASEKSQGTVGAPDTIIVPPELQQWVLDIFKKECEVVSGDSLNSTIQEIKQHLFERDFVKAFGKPEYLGAYAARWSPTRALCYLDILVCQRAITDRFPGPLQALQARDDLVEGHRKNSINNTTISSLEAPLLRPMSNETMKKQKIAFLGAGGGAELAAFAAFLRQIDSRVPPASHYPGQFHYSPDPPFDCVFVDAADWSPVLSRLYSSASTSSSSITSVSFSMTAKQQDILKATKDDLDGIVADASLVTLMFTLNELYATSLGSTTKMLLHLTSIMKPGAMLLVVDSPGSYSTVRIGDPQQTAIDSAASNESKPSETRYPMHWLLDHTLLESATIQTEKGSHKQWEKLESEKSKWFRLPRLQYPLALEDMRYQMHLFQRL